MGLKSWIKDAPVASFGPFHLRPNNEIEKWQGEDRGRHSIEGVTVELERGADLQKRVTAGRVLMTGVFSLAIKKKSGGEWWLTIEGDGFGWISEVPRKKQADAHKFVQNVLAAQRGLNF